MTGYPRKPSFKRGNELVELPEKPEPDADGIVRQSVRPPGYSAKYESYRQAFRNPTPEERARWEKQVEQDRANEVKRALSVLTKQGWTRGKEGSYSPPGTLQVTSD